MPNRNVEKRFMEGFAFNHSTCAQSFIYLFICLYSICVNNDNNACLLKEIDSFIKIMF